MTRFGKIGQNAQLAILGLLPIAALFGNAVADIALVLTVLIYLSTERNALRDLRQSHFFQLAFIFWVWICICSAVSLFPKNSFQDSLPWIRFPLFAFALAHFLADQKGKKFKIFIGSAILGTLIQLTFMYKEYFFSSTSYYHLSGTYSKGVAGWYLIGIGLVGSLFALQKLLFENISPVKKVSTIFFISACASGLIISKEIMNSIVFLSIIGLILFSNIIIDRKQILYSALGIFIMLFVIGLMIFMMPDIHARATVIASRLPWNENSDYYPIWKGSLELISHNLLFGIGPKNTFLFTRMLEQTGLLYELLKINQTLWHSHNLYLQTIVETGVVGLIFLITMVAYLINILIKNFSENSPKIIIQLNALIIIFFPLQSYSQAFGQFRNFFLWLTIGYILSITKSMVQK